MPVKNLVAHSLNFRESRKRAVLPQELGYDVCGLQPFNQTLLTHQHLDHLPARKVRILCAPILLKTIALKMGGLLRVYEVEEYTDCFETEHWFFNGNRWVKIKTYGYFIGNVAVIPESVDADSYVEEYSLKGLVVVCFKQPRSHLNNGNKLRSPCHLPANCYFADPSTWSRYAPNVLPKVVPSIADIKRFGQYWADNPFKNIAELL